MRSHAATRAHELRLAREPSPREGPAVSRTTWLWIAGGVVLVAVVTVVLMNDDDPPANPQTTAAPTEPEPPPPPDIGPALAPAGQFIDSVDPMPTGVLRLATSSSEGGARFCAIGFEEGTGEPLSRALCMPLVERGRVLAVPDDVFGAVLRDGTLFDLRGTTLSREVNDSATMDRAGTLASIVPAPNGGTIVVRRGAEVVFERPIEASQALVLPGGRVVFTSSEDVLSGVTTDRPDAEIVEIGRVPAGTDAIRACTSGSQIVVITHGNLSHGERSVGVSFFDGTSWSAPVEGRATLTEYKLACREGLATLTWPEVVNNAGVLLYQIHQTTCRPDGCTLVSSAAQIAGSDPVAVDLAGKVLLVWGSDSGTRARLAPMTDLDGGTTITSFEAPGVRVLARRVEVRRSTAVVLIRTDHGLVAYRVDAEGAVRQLDVRELSEPP
jgi:hypothetical protein